MHAKISSRFYLTDPMKRPILVRVGCVTVPAKIQLKHFARKAL